MGPHVPFPVLECLRCLDEIGEQVNMIAPHVKGHDGEDVMLQIAAYRVRAIVAMLRGFFERDPDVSMLKVYSLLAEYQRRLPIQELFGSRNERGAVP